MANKSWHGTSKSPLNTISLSQAAVLQGRESSKPNETRRREKKERENELNTHDEETRRGLKRPGSSAGVAPKHEKGIKNITKKRRKRRRIKKMSREGKRREREREREPLLSSTCDWKLLAFSTHSSSSSSNNNNNNHTKGPTVNFVVGYSCS